MPVRVYPAAVGAAGALVLLLAGCGSSGGSVPVGSTSRPDGASAPGNAASTDAGAAVSESSGSDQSGDVVARYVVTVGQGQFVQFGPGDAPTPQPTNGMYDFAYNGGKSFSTNETAGMRDITGSQWRTCRDWSSDHNATGQASVTNVAPGHEICYSTSNYLVDIVVTGYGASSATIRVTIGRG